MIATAVWRWILSRLVASPSVWFAALLLGMGLPVLHGLRPASSFSNAWDQAVPWSLPAGLLGATLALVALSRGTAFLDRLDAGGRFAGEFGALWGGGLILQLPILGGALLSGATLLDAGRGLVAILIFTLHLAGIALLALIPNFSTTLRASLFLTITWIVPALCAADSGLARLAVWVDVRAPLRSGVSTALAPTLVSALALLLAAYVLRGAPTREMPG